MITIPASGNVIVGSTFVTDAELGAALSAAVADYPGGIVLMADPTVSYARILAVIEHAKKAGFSTLVFGNDRDAPPTRRLLSAAAASIAKKASLVITIPASGDVFVGARRVPDADLDKALAAVAERETETPIVVTADLSVSTARVLRLIMRARRAGLRDLAIESQRPKTRSPARRPVPAPSKATGASAPRPTHAAPK